MEPRLRIRMHVLGIWIYGSRFWIEGLMYEPKRALVPKLDLSSGSKNILAEDGA